MIDSLSPSLLVNQEPVAPTIIAPPMSQAYLLGDLVNISCLATGVPAPTYQWFFNGVELEGETFPYYIIFSVAPENRGVYYCTATNKAESVTADEAQITIDGIWLYHTQHAHNVLLHGILLCAQVYSSTQWHLMSQIDAGDSQTQLQW